MKRYRGWKLLLRNLDFVFAGVNLTALVVLTFLGVIFRYVLQTPFTWLEEVQQICMVLIVYSSAGAAFREGGHVAVEILVDFLPAGAKKIAQLYISVVLTAIILYLLVNSIGYVQMFISSGRSSNMLSIPYQYVYAFVPLSCVSMIYNYFLVTYGKKSSAGEVECNE